MVRLDKYTTEAVKLDDIAPYGHDFMNDALRKFYEDSRDKIIVDVLGQVLRREPEVADFEMLSFKFNDDPASQYVFYNDFYLGAIIVPAIGPDLSVKVEFIPIEYHNEIVAFKDYFKKRF